MTSQSKSKPCWTVKLGQIETLGTGMTVIYDWIIEDLLVRCSEAGRKYSDCGYLVEFCSNSFIVGKEVLKSSEWQATLSHEDNAMSLGMKLIKYLGENSQLNLYVQSVISIRCKLTCSVLNTDGSLIFHKVGPVVEFTSADQVHCVRMMNTADLKSSAEACTRGGNFHCRIEMDIYGDRAKRNIEPKTFGSPSLKPQNEYYEDVDNLSADFGKLMTNEASSDVVLKCGNKSFRAHKLILSARSPVFEAMFRHGTEECNVDEFEPEIVSLLLKYIYRGKLDKLNDEQIISVVQAADKYGLVKLKDFYMEVLGTRITKQNFASFAILSYLHGGGKIVKGHLKSFFHLNAATMLSSAEFREMVKQYPDSLNQFD